MESFQHRAENNKDSYPVSLELNFVVYFPPLTEIGMSSSFYTNGRIRRTRCTREQKV